MPIKTHDSLGLDGFSTTEDGWPAITQVTEFKPKETHGIPESRRAPWRWRWAGRRSSRRSATVAAVAGAAGVRAELAGLPLFPPGDSRQPLRLTRRQEHPDSSLELFYERA